MQQQTTRRPPIPASVRLWLGILAWLVALLAIELLGSEPGRTFGAFLAIIAGAIAIIAWQPWKPNDWQPTATVDGQANTESLSRTILRLVGIPAALLLDLLACLFYLWQPTETFGLAGWLWLASIALLVASTVALSATTRPTTTSQEESPRWPRWEITVLAGIALLALVLRVWNLRDFPNNIFPDEIMTGTITNQAYLSSTPGPPIFSTLWGDIDLPALWFLFVSLSLKIGGTTLAALRLPAALFGAATVLPFYGLVRMVWGRNAAIAGATIMAFSAADVHYSRLALSNIVTPFFWTLCFFFLVRGLRSRRPLDWALAGLVAGLSEYGFYATRLLPILLLVFIAYMLIVHWRQFKSYIVCIALLVAGYIVGFGPLLAHFATHPNLYVGHGASVLVWNHIPTSLEDLGAMWFTLWPLFAQNLLGFSTIPSQEIIYFAPMLLPVEAAFLILGVALLIRDWRHPAAFLMLLTGLGVLVIGGTLVRGTPFLNHWTAAFPVFYFAVAIPIAAWTGKAQEWLPAKWNWVAPGVLAAGLVILGALNIRFYFSDYYANPDLVIDPAYRTAQQYYETQNALSRYMGALGPNYMLRAVNNNSVAYDPTTTIYLSGTPDYGNIQDPANEPLLQPEAGKGIIFVFFPGREQYQPVIQSRYPGGTTDEVLSQGGRHLFYTYNIPGQ